MATEIVHRSVKRSWWDGTVITACGQKFRPGYYKECWFHGGITCPGCKKASRWRR